MREAPNDTQPANGLYSVPSGHVEGLVQESAWLAVSESALIHVSNERSTNESNALAGGSGVSVSAGLQLGRGTPLQRAHHLFLKQY